MEKYISPKSEVIEFAAETMLALSANNEIGDGTQLSNKQESYGWDASQWDDEMDVEE